MNSSQHHTTVWLIESQLAPFVDAFTHNLIKCRYHPPDDALMQFLQAL